MLSLRELTRVCDALSVLQGTRVQRIVQTDDYTLYLELYGWDKAAQKASKPVLLLSCHPQFARVCMAPELPQAPPWPPEFAAFLKANLGRARLASLRLHEGDRLLSLMFEHKQGGLELLLSLMGPRSNLYALCTDGQVKAAMRPLASTRSDLKLGQPWQDPEQRHVHEPTDRWPELAGEALLAAVHAHFSAAEEHARFEAEHNLLRGAIRREFEFAERRAAKLARDLDAAKHAREQKQLGELLKTVMHDLPHGAKSARANDFETGQEVEIPLDPALSPAENLERYFKHYHKGLVGTNKLGQQLEITQTHLDELRAMQTELEQADSAGQLAALAARPEFAALRARHAPQPAPARPPKKKPQRKDVPSRLLPRRYRTTDGLEVWVGRSDEGNDYLTTRLARGNDLFFHVEGYPGSHTILRMDGKSDPPQESVLEAAELAVQHSKLKDANKVTVHIAPIKHVHKPKGAKPGLVYVNKGSSIVLRRDKTRLQRVLGALIKAEG